MKWNTRRFYKAVFCYKLKFFLFIILKAVISPIFILNKDAFFKVATFVAKLYNDSGCE